MILNFEGFESIGTTTGQANAAQPLIDLAKRHTVLGTLGATDRPYLIAGPSGGYALAFDATNRVVAILSPAGYASNSNDVGPTTVIGFNYKTRPSGSHTDEMFYTCEHTSNPQAAALSVTGVALRCVNSTNLTIHRGGSPTDLASGAGAGSMTADTWHYIEIKLKVANTGGILEVKVNGSTVINFTGDTRATNSFYAPTSFVFGLSGNSTAASLTDYPAIDDIYVLDSSGSVNNNFLGKRRVVSLPPDGDHSITWTPSTGSTHYNLVDENPNSDADYVETDKENVDEYTLTDATVANVDAVKTEVEAVNTDTGDPILGVGVNGSLHQITLSNTSNLVFARAIDADWSNSDLNAARLTLESLLYPGRIYNAATPDNPSSTLTDHPMLIDMADLTVDWWDAVQSDGGDIRITVDGLLVPFDLIEWDYGSETGLLLCKATKTTGNQVFRVWAGGPSGSVLPADSHALGRFNAYPSHARGFWPTGGGNDRTINVNHLTMTGSPSASTGPIGNVATLYNGSTQMGVTAITLPAGEPMSMLAAGKTTATAQGQIICHLGQTGGVFHRAGIQFSNIASGRDIAGLRQGVEGYAIAEATAAYSDGAWAHVACVYPSLTSRTIYLNGGNSATNSDARTSDPFTRFGVATFNAAAWSSGFGGDVSLVWLHDVELSAAWIAYQNSQLNQSSFWNGWSDP